MTRSLRAFGLLCAAAVVGFGVAACGGGNPAEEAPLTPVGLTADAAGDLAETEGWSWRIVEEDGESLAVSQDFIPERLNFVVAEGVVVSAKTDAELSGG